MSQRRIKQTGWTCVDCGFESSSRQTMRNHTQTKHNRKPIFDIKAAFVPPCSILRIYATTGTVFNFPVDTAALALE